MTTAAAYVYECGLEGCPATFDNNSSRSRHQRYCRERTLLERQNHRLTVHRAKTTEERKNNSYNAKKWRSQLVVDPTAQNQLPVWYPDHIRSVNQKVLQLLPTDMDPFLRDLTTEEAMEMLSEFFVSTCFYCGSRDPIRFCGIDRIDSNLPYITTNIVPACNSCNMMKGNLLPHEFLEMVRHIVVYQETKIAVPFTLPLQPPIRKGDLKKQIVERCRIHKFDCELTDADYVLYDDPTTICTYCGISRSILVLGVDRRNAQMGYLRDNCVPCCSPCNLLKRSMSVDEFVAHVQKVVAFMKGSYGDVSLTLEAQMVTRAMETVPLKMIVHNEVDSKRGPKFKQVVIQHDDPQAASIPISVMVAKASKVYHNSTCTDILNLNGETSNFKHGYTEVSYEAALKRSRRPCKRCRKFIFPEETAPIKRVKTMQQSRSQKLLLVAQ